MLLWPRLCHSFEVHLSLFHVVSLLHSEFGGDFNGEGTVSDKSLREIRCLCTGCADFSMEIIGQMIEYGFNRLIIDVLSSFFVFTVLTIHQLTQGGVEYGIFARL